MGIKEINQRSQILIPSKFTMYRVTTGTHDQSNTGAKWVNEEDIWLVP